MKLKRPPLAWLSGVLLGVSLALGAGATVFPWKDSDTPPAIVNGALLVVDREALAYVDLQLIHEELIPDWVVSSGGMKRMHFERILREVSRDKNLSAILARMRVLFEDDPVRHASELLSLVRVWNDYLAKAGEPWRLAGEIRANQEAVLHLKSYRVISEGSQVTVGSEVFTAEIRRRVDSTTLVDSWLGSMHDHEDGVVILLDSVAQFALDQVWIMLDPYLDEHLDPVARAFAPAVREEIEAALGSDLSLALQHTAEDRYWMSRARDAIHDRHSCGSSFVVARIPWDGLDSKDIATLQRSAELTSPCPEVTETEALLFAVRSNHIRSEPKIAEAVERLLGAVAGAVVIHEARHAADDRLLQGQSIPCVGCPDGTSHTAALEGSAYAASFSHPRWGALSLYQACALSESHVPERTAMIRFLADQISEGGCESPPPLDLAERARRVELRVFGHGDPIDLVDFPVSLPAGASP